jgi:hypothetical protein
MEILRTKSVKQARAARRLERSGVLGTFLYVRDLSSSLMTLGDMESGGRSHFLITKHLQKSQMVRTALPKAIAKQL